MDTEIQYLTPQEVSERWRGRVTVRTLSNWRCLGTGPRYSKIGGRILYPLEEIKAWEEGRTVSSTASYSADLSRQAAGRIVNGR